MAACAAILRVPSSPRGTLPRHLSGLGAATLLWRLRGGGGGSDGGGGRDLGPSGHALSQAGGAGIVGLQSGAAGLPELEHFLGVGGTGDETVWARAHVPQLVPELRPRHHVDVEINAVVHF